MSQGNMEFHVVEGSSENGNCRIITSVEVGGMDCSYVR
jgi:hypothetical protein